MHYVIYRKTKSDFKTKNAWQTPSTHSINRPFENYMAYIASYFFRWMIRQGIYLDWMKQSDDDIGFSQNNLEENRITHTHRCE